VPCTHALQDTRTARRAAHTTKQYCSKVPRAPTMHALPRRRTRSTGHGGPKAAQPCPAQRALIQSVHPAVCNKLYGQLACTRDVHGGLSKLYLAGTKKRSLRQTV
jgi:hypothetical protein